MVDWSTVDTVVCDIDGVVLLDSGPIAGVADALRRIEAAGIRIRFLTNNSTKSRDTIAQKISDVAGFATSPDYVINSGWATGVYIAGAVTNVFVAGTDGLRDTLRSAGLDIVHDWREADAVVVGLDFNVTFDQLRDASLAVQHGAAFYATNTDPNFPTSEGLIPGAGALVALVATTTGVDPVVCGKPHEPMLQVLGDFAGRHAVMVGDRPDTDVALGQVMGWTTVLVLSGVTTSADEVPTALQPDLILPSLADLPAQLGI